MVLLISSDLIVSFFSCHVEVQDRYIYMNLLLLYLLVYIHTPLFGLEPVLRVCIAILRWDESMARLVD